jgi:ribosomal subunit interface protein
MDIFIKGKNGSVDEELESYATAKLGKLSRFSQRAQSLHVTFVPANSRRKDAACKVEFMLHLPGHALHVHEEAENFKAAVDLGVESLKTQLSKLTEKQVDRFRQAAGTAKVVIHTASNRLNGDGAAPPAQPQVLSEYFSVKPLGVSDAIKELDSSGRNWLVFVNQSGAVNCIYRRDDSHYGLLQPEGAA